MRVGACLAVASANGHTVDGEMLRSGCESTLLQTEYHLLAEFSDKIRILAVAFHYPAPARIARDVEKRSVDVGVAECVRLLGRNAGYLPDKVLVPCGSLAALRREHSGAVMVESADAFIREIDGDAESGLLHKPLLYGVAVVDARAVGIRQCGAERAETVCLLVDVGDSVFPYLLYPTLGRQRVL